MKTSEMAILRRLVYDSIELMPGNQSFRHDTLYKFMYECQLLCGPRDLTNVLRWLKRHGVIEHDWKDTWKLKKRVDSRRICWEHFERIQMSGRGSEATNECLVCKRRRKKYGIARKTNK